MLTYIELIIAPILFIYSILLTVKWKKAKRAKKTFIILSISASILIAYNGITNYKKQSLIAKIEARYGDILEGNNSSIPNIALGNPDFFFVFSYPKNQYGIFVDETQEFIKVYVRNGKLFVNVIIRDYENDVIAVISDNTWKLFDNNYEYNNDETAFELVTKGYRKVLMHIEYNDGCVFLEGFYTSQISGAFFKTMPNVIDQTSPDVDKYMGDRIGMVVMRHDNEKDALVKYKEWYLEYLKTNTIKPLFKYPREKYLGVRVDSIK